MGNGFKNNFLYGTEMRYNYPGLIDFELEEIGDNCLRFEIYEQDVSITCNGRGRSGDSSLRFSASNGLTIRSYDYVDLENDNMVYLKGADISSPPFTIREYKNNGVRIQMRKEILSAFEEFAASKGITLSTYPQPTQLSLWD
jgi:hypothetical protein